MNRFARIIGFSVIYFSIYLIHAFLFTIRTYVGTPEATYYLQRPLETLLMVVFELGRSSLFILTLFQLMISALVLGFITDWIYGLLRKHLSKNKTRILATKNLM